jgi:hypothetical protein
MNFFSRNYSFPSGMGRKDGSILREVYPCGSMFYSRRKFLHFFVSAFFAIVFISFLRITVVSQRNDHPAFCTFGW